MVDEKLFAFSSTKSIHAAALAVAVLVFCSGLSIFASAVAKTDVPKEVKKPVELNATNVEAWRRHILPDESELQWRKIPWLWTLQEGILKAAEAKRPVLLWTMNGHPLGCT